MKFLIVSVLLLCQLSAVHAFAADDEDKDKDAENEVANILNSMGYPELQVVPRASERLRMEAKDERGNWFIAHWPIELSGLVTMGVGLSTKDRDGLKSKDQDDAKMIRNLTTAVGGAWVVGGLILGLQKPYATGYRRIGKPVKDERGALMRERLAEEALERPAKTMRVLQHISVATNFVMNGLSAIHADDKGRVVAGVGAVLSFLPYMFEDHQITAYNKHVEYKKKIYTPIKGASLYYDPDSQTVTPMTTFTWNL
jgi:hypothetical protein